MPWQPHFVVHLDRLLEERSALFEFSEYADAKGNILV